MDLVTGNTAIPTHQTDITASLLAEVVAQHV